MNMLPHKDTGKVYSHMRFKTCSLPCFNKVYDLFYPAGKKVVPQNIGELLKPLGLAYWICDDGSFNKKDRAVVLSTQGFTLQEVNLLIKALSAAHGGSCKHDRSARPAAAGRRPPVV